MKKPDAYVTKAELARRHVQSLILGGSLGPGDRITTREISDALGISETPARETLRSLASEGWVEIRNHIGAVVQGLKPDQIREISALRGRICGLAIELGASSFDEERLALIDDSIDAYARELDRKDYAALAELNYQFHDLLCDTPQSRWCRRMIDNMHGLMSAQRHGIPPQHSRLAEALDEHKSIRDMLRLENYAGAAEMAQKHETNTGTFLIKMMGERSDTEQM